MIEIKVSLTEDPVALNGYHRAYGIVRRLLLTGEWIVR